MRGHILKSLGAAGAVFLLALAALVGNMWCFRPDRAERSGTTPTRSRRRRCAAASSARSSSSLGSGRRPANTDNTPQRYSVDGTPFRVLAIDGNEVHGSTALAHRTLKLAAGGRYDVGFTMPARPVRLSVPNTQAGLLLSVDGSGGLAPSEPGPDFDPLHYGAPAATPFGAASRFDRRFRFSIGRKPGFFDGRPGMQWSINGSVFPDVPMYVVRRGDLVEVTIENHTKAVHPMHLHGHRMLVLSRDGEAPTGSPWWTDTLDVDPGERFEVAFRADNPGIWMDHCHNLRHASEGPIMHLAYEGVATPYRIGGTAHNHPE